MTSATRRYSEKTLKLLFGSSGNQCAAPGCTNEIIVAGTADSDAAVIGQICHIYAAADNGPRGKPGLTEEARNASENLILLCGYHHPLVDKQWESYPAETLKAWKSAHEAKFQKGTAEAAKEQASMQRLAFFQAYSDQQINAEVEAIKKGRFLGGVPTRERALALAARIDVAELAGGSNEVRARAFAWCARVLSHGDTVARADELLAKSKALGSCEDAKLVEAIIIATTDKNKALALLAQIDSPAARSAAFRIVTTHDSAKGALDWAKRAGLDLDHFDPDGKLAIIMNGLSAEEWDCVISNARKITDEDFATSPVLYHAVALSSLIEAVPPELRAAVVSHVPFEANTFPLASHSAALEARRRATVLFLKVSAFARSMGVATASNQASDYAFWLRLRDPRDHEQGMDELRDNMRDPSQSLRRLNLALQFGIKLDLAAIEREIDQRVALSGNGTADEAFARFSLAFVQESPQAVAAYIAKHRIQLYQHLHKASVQMIEIETLAHAGMIGTANEMLARVAAEGLGSREQEHLRQIISQSEGADPALQRRKLYEQTNSVRDLVNLVNFLEQRRAWAELLPYAETLFDRTSSLEDACRIAVALNASALHARLYAFLFEHPDLVAQSIVLKTFWAWSLYREGRFNDSGAILKTLAADRDDANDRALRVNIALSSGDWDDLVEYSNSEWNNRQNRSAGELLLAGKLAHAVNGPRARDLITFAAEKAPDDPQILAAAYFHAVSAGWEQSPTTGQWLSRAAKLSGEDGPLKSMSMKELLDRKPKWDKLESSVWQQLNEGAIPTFGAARLLNRSLVDFMLLQSVANLAEHDTRRRAIVYAYSGARSGFVRPTFARIALDLGAILTLANLNLLDTLLRTYKSIVIPRSTLSWLFHERESVNFHQPSRIRDAHLIARLVATNALKVLRAQSVHSHALAKEVGGDLATLLTTVKSRSESKDGVPRYVIRSAPVHRVGSLMQEEADLSAYASCLCSCQAVVSKLRSRGLFTLGEEDHACSYLKLHERSWPSEPEIADGAELYLDDLSVTYLTTVGAIDKLQPAGLTAFITAREETDANRLIALENLAGRQLTVIETIRRGLAGALKSGQVRASKLRDGEEPDDTDRIRAHPSFAVLEAGENVDGFVIDDRFINRHAHMTTGEKQTPILSSLNVLDDLADRGVISKDLLYAYRTELRRAGYQLIPVTEDELSHHLDKAQFDGDALVEMAELRAIRESLLRARMSKMLQMPAEIPWLQSSMTAIIRTIRRAWRVKSDRKEAIACVEWLVGLLDPRGFAASAIPGNENSFALHAYAAQVLQVMTPPNGVSDEIRKAYFEWVESYLLRDMKDTQPEGYRWIVARVRELVTHTVKNALAKVET